MALSYRKRKPGEKIEWIVVHYTGVPGCTADDIVRNFERTADAVSTHYVICGDQVRECVFNPEQNAAYHCGAKEGTRNGCYNGNSIGVDLCELKDDCKSRSVKDGDWYFDRQTLETAARFIARLMIRHNVRIDHVCRHFDVTGKVCPRPFVGKDESKTIRGMSCDDLWSLFLVLIEDCENVLWQLARCECQSRGNLPAPSQPSSDDLKRLASWEAST